MPVFLAEIRANWTIFFRNEGGFWSLLLYNFLSSVKFKSICSIFFIFLPPTFFQYTLSFNRLEILVIKERNRYNFGERGKLMIRLICIYAALFIAGIYTINAYWIGMNDQTTIAMFDRYPILFAPASYVYLIWLVFFLLAFLLH